MKYVYQTKYLNQMNMKNLLIVAVLVLTIISCQQPSKKLFVNQMDLSKMEIGWGKNQVDASVDGNPLSIAGKVFEQGIGTHAVSQLLIDVHGKATQFTAWVGVDDETGTYASVEFFVLGDGKVLYQSGIMTKGDEAKKVDVDLKGIQKMALFVSDGGDNINYDHADWIEPVIVYQGQEPQALEAIRQPVFLLTPEAPESPRINYPRVYGAGVNKPFVFRIPASGLRPMNFTASGLPSGLTLDATEGVISGKARKAGVYEVQVVAKNQHGSDTQILTLSIGNGLSLTPPMGWNSWNCWGLSVTQDQVKAAGDALISSGLADHGWAFVNIDDGWEAPQREASGELLPNDKFPNMKALADKLHQNGLKLGIYSSPGPKTCGDYLGSWQHEQQDAHSWAKWGIDYIKYDWCSYGNIAPDRSLPELQKPYQLMRECLNKVDRDIVYSLCQYGMGDVWTWGSEVGGNLWRTTGDITDSWTSMAGIGFDQDQCAPYAGPGHWNDPDMLVVGQVGWGPSLHQTKLTPDEQYTHISLWSLLAAPLLIGCDLTQLDTFTLNLLCNDEVIAVNQDPLGKQAIRVKEENGMQIWKKDMQDGTLAVGLFYTGTTSPEEAINWDGKIKTKAITLRWDDLGISGVYRVRDVWRQQDLGDFEEEFTSDVAYHGVMLVRMEKVE